MEETNSFDLNSYISNSYYHQSFNIPITNRRVTFSECGDLKGIPVLLCHALGVTRISSII